MIKSQPKISFDAMTIVGNINKNNAQKLSEFMSVEPQIRLWDIVIILIMITTFFILWIWVY